jgi:hypothetical protein
MIIAAFLGVEGLGAADVEPVVVQARGDVRQFVLALLEKRVRGLLVSCRGRLRGVAQGGNRVTFAREQVAEPPAVARRP